MSPRNSYLAYGFRLDSSVSIAGLNSIPATSAAPDLSLDTGPASDWALQGTALPGHILSHQPASEDGVEPNFVLTEYGNAACFDLSYSDGTRFVVDSAARRIWGTFQPPLTPEDFATYFLGPVMGFLLRRRHITALHASCVRIADCAVALSGEAGFGKSTTAAALALRGFPVLSEDIVPLENAPSGFCAVPGYPRVCLWPDSVEKLLGSPEALPRLTPVWEKRFLPLDGVRAHFCAEKLPLGAIYLFAERSTDSNAPRVQELRPREALLHLVQNTYMNWLLDREQRAAEFDQLASLVERIPVRRIVPHAEPQRIGALCDVLVDDANRLLAAGTSTPAY